MSGEFVVPVLACVLCSRNSTLPVWKYGWSMTGSRPGVDRTSTGASGDSGMNSGPTGGAAAQAPPRPTKRMLGSLRIRGADLCRVGYSVRRYGD
jgi:hypothetical protein